MGIKNENIKYYINEEKGVVAASVDFNCCYGLEHEIINIARKSFEGDSRFLPGLNNIMSFLPGRITVKAVVAEGDVFSVEKGKEIARRKLFIKYYKKRAELISDIIESYSDFVDRLQSSLEYSERSIVKLEENLKKDIE